VLNCVNVRSIHIKGTSISDVSLKKLTTFKKLDYLSLEKTKIGAAGLEAISGAPIQHVAMEDCELSEDLFRALGKMTTLEELWLDRATMKADWLKHISALPKLRQLNLRDTSFDDAAAKYLTAMPKLQSLTLQDTMLGDAGLQELVKHPTLKVLYVSGSKVTEEACKKARKEHPNLTIQY